MSGDHLLPPNPSSEAETSYLEGFPEQSDLTPKTDGQLHDSAPEQYTSFDHLQGADEQHQHSGAEHIQQDEPAFDHPVGLSDMARSSQRHGRRWLGLFLLVAVVLAVIAGVVGARYWLDQQKIQKSALPSAITPAGDNQAVSIGNDKGASLGVGSKKSNKTSPSDAGSGKPDSDANLGGSANPADMPGTRPAPRSGPATANNGAVFTQAGPGQPAMPAPLTNYDPSGRPIAPQPIIPLNRFDSPLGSQDGRGYVNATSPSGTPNVAGGAANSNNLVNGANGLFNPMAFLGQMPGAPGAGGANASANSANSGSFSGSLSSTKTPSAKASISSNLSLTLSKGALIPCALDTAINSSRSSMVRCHTPKNVFSEDGKVVLLEAGSKFKGEFSNSALKTGDKRLYVLWSRVDTPFGVRVDLESPGADQLGRGGLDGDLDKHWGERIGTAALLSFVQDAVGYAATRGGNQNSAGVYQNTTNTGNQMATEVLRDTLAIPPTLTINQGEIINIFVARDLDFSDVYQLRTK